MGVARDELQNQLLQQGPLRALMVLLMVLRGPCVWDLYYCVPLSNLYVMWEMHESVWSRSLLFWLSQFLFSYAISRGHFRLPESRLSNPVIKNIKYMNQFMCALHRFSIGVHYYEWIGGWTRKRWSGGFFPSVTRDAHRLTYLSMFYVLYEVAIRVLPVYSWRL